MFISLVIMWLGKLIRCPRNLWFKGIKLKKKVLAQGKSNFLNDKRGTL